MTRTPLQACLHMPQDLFLAAVRETLNNSDRSVLGLVLYYTALFVVAL